MNDSDEFEERIMTEYRQLTSKITEANDIIQELKPKLHKLSELITAYGLQAKLQELKDGDDVATGSPNSVKKGEQIASLCTKYFMAHDNQWARLSELYDFLLSKGVVVGGANPNSTLSAHLGNSGSFEGQRAKGWRLNKDTWSAR